MSAAEIEVKALLMDVLLAGRRLADSVLDSVHTAVSISTVTSMDVASSGTSSGIQGQKAAKTRPSRGNDIEVDQLLREHPHD